MADPKNVLNWFTLDAVFARRDEAQDQRHRFRGLEH
jgi:hypothetical protein